MANEAPPDLPTVPPTSIHAEAPPLEIDARPPRWLWIFLILCLAIPVLSYVAVADLSLMTLHVIIGGMGAYACKIHARDYRKPPARARGVVHLRHGNLLGTFHREWIDGGSFPIAMTLQL